MVTGSNLHKTFLEFSRLRIYLRIIVILMRLWWVPINVIQSVLICIGKFSFQCVIFFVYFDSQLKICFDQIKL